MMAYTLLPKDVQKALAIKLLGKSFPVMGDKKGKWVVVAWMYEFEGETYRVEVEKDE